MPSIALTICSVSFESRDWLRLNRQLLERLNPGVDVRWVIAENSPANSAQQLSESDGFERVPGAAFVARPVGAASYHHASGLAQALRQVSGRFLLVLDPDFLIVRPGWVREVLDHIETRGLALFGAPWHPSRPRKIRYFPCGHCTFVDLDRIPLASLDFSPDLENEPAASRRGAGRGLLGRIDLLDVGERKRIGLSRDTGWRLFDRFAADPDVRVECLQPVYRPGRLRRWLEWPLPDRLSLVPKRRGYSRTRGLASEGLPDLGALGWEEFFWRDRPFGVHIRCHPIRLKNPNALRTHLERAQRLVETVQAPSTT